jgi:deoxyadenosine/deoxycytidine kinase
LNIFAENVLNRSLELQWQTKLHTHNSGLFPVVSVCGPSGAGKTTVATALSKSYPTYIETIAGNKHLKGFLHGKSDFNAEANQTWFLRRIARHIARADPCLPLVLDQDPAAIVLGYSSVFVEEQKLTDAQYALLLKRLLIIEKKLCEWRCPRTVLFLDAPAAVLHQRIYQRCGKSHTPPLDWFEFVRNRFVQLFTCFPNAVAVSTVNHSPEQVIARARSLIKSRVKDLQT